MKRTLLIAVVIVSSCGLVSSASAGQKKRNREQTNNSNSSNSNGNVQNYTQIPGSNLQTKLKLVDKFRHPQTEQSSNIRPSWKAPCASFGSSTVSGIIEKLHDKKHQKPVQLDPGRPDGRVEVADVPTTATLLQTTAVLQSTPVRPGYVWVNGHWERLKGDPNGYGWNSVSNPHGHPVGVRPEPSSGIPVVTVTPGSTTRDNTIYGSGPGPVAVWNFIHPTLPELTLEESRDHRTPNK